MFPTSDIFGRLMHGFLDSAQIAAAVGLFTLGLLLFTSYSTGMLGDGQDTVWGLGYFDRLKLLFDSPGVTGSYFVIAMSFAIYAVSLKPGAGEIWRKRGLFFLIQISPWLVVASGSRVARITLVVLICTGLLWQPVRRTVLIALPSSIIALMVGLDFQSLPGAVKFYLDHVIQGVFDGQNLDGLRLGSRFWEWGARGELTQQAYVIFKENPLTNKLLGTGYGVAGFSASSYPLPHNQYMGMLIEVGFFGFVAYMAFWFICILRVFGGLRQQGRFGLTLGWSIGVGIVSLVGLSVAYEISSKGIVLVLLLMVISFQPKTRQLGNV